jgi:hypothetical protein
MKLILQQTARTGYRFVIGVISIPHAGENMSCGIRWSLLRSLNILFGARRSTLHFVVYARFRPSHEGASALHGLIDPTEGALTVSNSIISTAFKAKRFALRSTGKRLKRKTLLLDTPPVLRRALGMRRQIKFIDHIFVPDQLQGGPRTEVDAGF